VTEATATEAAIEVPADATPVIKLGQRDGAIVIAALSLFAAADTWHATTGLAFAALLAVLNGVVVGTVIGTLAHEWGHFAGARWFGGIAPTRSITSFFPIFDLDLQRSSERSFRAMSVGGNLGHWLAFLALAALIPLDSAGRNALVASAFAAAVSASATEIPIIRRAFAGASPVASFEGLSRELLRRNNWIGAGAGVALFLIL
jgi:hypothetical protein